MDNPTTLLVAIMYVTIIAIGLSQLLMTLSELAGDKVPLPDRVHLSWLLLLLLAYFTYFWQTTEILEVDSWDFVGFMAFLTGPVILLFATNLLVVLPDADSQSKQQHYLDISGRFFLLMALFQGWLVGLDIVTDGVTLPTYLAAALGLLCVGLMFSTNYPRHKVGAGVAWLLFLSSVANYVVQ